MFICFPPHITATLIIPRNLFDCKQNVPKKQMFFEKSEILFTTIDRFYLSISFTKLTSLAVSSTQAGLNPLRIALRTDLMLDQAAQ